MLRESGENLLDLQPGDRSDIVNRNHQGVLHEGSVAGTEKGTSANWAPAAAAICPAVANQQEAFGKGADLTPNDQAARRGVLPATIVPLNFG